MDQIKFIIEEAKALKTVDFKSYDVSVYLNDKKMPHTIFNAPAVLPLHRVNDAQFDLFTCSCGAAGCAGFQSPVKQTKGDGVFIWNFPESNDYTTEKKVYVFADKAFKKAFTELNKQMNKLEKQNIFHYTCIRDNTSYGYKEEDGVPLFETESYLKDYVNNYYNSYKGTENFEAMLKAVFPDLIDKKFKFTYEGQLGYYVYDLGDVVCRVMNDYPSKAIENRFLNKALVTMDSVLEILGGNNQLMKKMAEKNYAEVELTSHSMISQDFKVKEEDFNFDKVGLVVVE